jgi:hypothetical protein
MSVLARNAVLLVALAGAGTASDQLSTPILVLSVIRKRSFLSLSAL